MEDFAFDILEALNANQQLDMLHAARPEVRPRPRERRRRSMLGLPDWAELNSELFMHTVMPNLTRLGLITERTEEQYRERGMLVGDHLAPRSSLPGI